MTNLNFDGMAIADGVIETIVSLAVKDVEGVAALSSAPSGGILPSRKPKAAGVEVMPNEDGSIAVAIRVEVLHGYSLPAVADSIRQAVADAALAQIGVPTSSVDVYIDGIQFA